VEATPDTGFMQASWWVDFRNTCGFENFGIILKEGRDILGGAVVLKFSYAEDRCFYYIQDGPVLPGDPDSDADIYRAIFEAIEDRRRAEPGLVSHLRIEPRWLRLPDFVSGFRAIPPLADPYFEARDTRCIDLRPSESDILAQMKPKGRYNIRLAQRHGVSVVEDASERGLADFLRLYKRTTARKEIGAKPTSYFRTLFSALSPPRRGSLFFAEYRGRRLATALVIYFGRRATYFYGGSLDLHRRVMAPYLLHFEIMRKARALGHECYDLWGIAPENEPDHPWANITAFKSKFGGQEVHLVPTLDYVYDPAAYDSYLAAEANPRFIERLRSEAAARPRS
jgi:lipid II:glycine glycyltransferase (peptidoglycan interpeptide bridge formation enzyme)